MRSTTDGRGHRTSSLAGEAAADGLIEVEGAPNDLVAGAANDDGSPSLGASARRQGLAMSRDRDASGHAPRAARGWRRASPSSKMRIASART